MQDYLYTIHRLVICTPAQHTIQLCWFDNFPLFFLSRGASASIYAHTVYLVDDATQSQAGSTSSFQYFPLDGGRINPYLLVNPSTPWANFTSADDATNTTIDVNASATLNATLASFSDSYTYGSRINSPLILNGAVIDAGAGAGPQPPRLQYDAVQVLSGVLKGVGQIYFQKDVTAGVLILIGIFLCSPISSVACLLGSITATMVALGLGVVSN